MRKVSGGELASSKQSAYLQSAELKRIPASYSYLLRPAIYLGIITNHAAPPVPAVTFLNNEGI